MRTSIRSDRHDGVRPRARRRVALCAAAIAIAVGAGAVDVVAQEPERPDTTATDSTVYEVEGIVVHGTRAVATLDGASAVDVRMDSLALSPAPTLEQVLRAMPIVQIRQNSRGEAHFAMRGAQERQIAVLVDGVPVTLGWDHRQDLSIVPMLAAQEIRLTRGLPSMLAGPNVLGGVVEVNVARRSAGPLEEPQPFQANLGVDHVGGRSAGAAVARRFEPDDGRVVVRAGAGLRESPGQPLAAGVSSADGEGDLRVNSDDERLDGFVAVRYRSDGGRWLSFAGSGFRAERGVPPENHVDDPRLWRYPSVGQLFTAVSGGTGQVETPLGAGDLEASVGFERGRAEIDEYGTPSYDQVVGGETGETRTLSLRLLGDHTVGPRGELRAAATLADVLHDEVLRPTLDERYTNRYQQRLWSVASELSWRFPTLPLTGGVLYGARLTGGVAIDGAYTPRTGGHEERPPIRDHGARLGFSALAGDGLRLHAGVSRRARFPALRELYSAALGKFEPNPELGPETLVAAEAGMTAHLAGGEIQAVGFHHRLKDAIVRTSSEVAKYKRINRDEIRSTGVELLGSWALGPVGVSGDVTFQRVRVLDPAASGDGADAEYNPEIAGGLDLSAPLPLDVRGTASAEYTGRQWCVVPGGGDAGMALDPYGRVDLRLDRSFDFGSRGPLSSLDATLAVDNVTDDAIYDQCGLPQPGRTLRLQFRIR